MDPYLERAEIWPDFHDSLITYIREVLQPALRPKYVALAQDRLFVVESDRPVRPDVSIIETSVRQGGSATATLVADEPIVIEVSEEEIREPYVQIIEPAAGNRIVTAIEVLSPDNKTRGSGRDSYLQKREEFWSSGTHVVEIDLLRSGIRTPIVEEESLTKGRQPPPAERPWRYFVTVSRRPARHEVYPYGLDERHPLIRVPLAGTDPDVVLNLQAAFERTWDAGPYPELLHYDAPPPGAVTDDELAFCRRMAGTFN
jgi:hypothetical protein